MIPRRQVHRPVPGQQPREAKVAVRLQHCPHVCHRQGGARRAAAGRDKILVPDKVDCCNSTITELGNFLYFLHFSIAKIDFFAFFIMLITYFCTSPILKALSKSNLLDYDGEASRSDTIKDICLSYILEIRK